ncbi:glycosyltransferase family 2 protein [Agromyces seonyuensis]|uniref:Glycosyltransferase n=1 Tax=Agromyces seonyuensis TaxID=2662446 RepID=A0A6I4NX27_9MICO|nr:hypothetical protein [Agromyces seonyuensis]MWB98843.1 hypothetical protein [Agromyces seonyuensis]
MNLGLVVTTLGRVEALGRLLDSLDGRLGDGDVLVLVAQDRHDEVAGLAAERAARGMPVIVTTSERGASRGRNAGVAALPDGERLLSFPNDTTWFPEGSVEWLRTHAAEIAAGSLAVVDEHGPKFDQPAPGTPLDRWTVWNVIEIGLLMRRSVFDGLGGFDPGIGTGATTPWQAGEGTDLLLRLLRDAPAEAADFVWVPLGTCLGGISDPHGLSTAARRRKLRAYGRGLGRLTARWRYPLWWRLAFIGGGLAFGLRNPATNSPGDGWSVFAGRLEGAVGRTFGAGPSTAVAR